MNNYYQFGDKVRLKGNSYMLLVLMYLGNGIYRLVDCDGLIEHIDECILERVNNE